METDQRPGAPGVGTRIGARFEEAGATPRGVVRAPREGVVTAGPAPGSESPVSPGPHSETQGSASLSFGDLAKSCERGQAQGGQAVALVNSHNCFDIS